MVYQRKGGGSPSPPSPLLSSSSSAGEFLPFSPLSSALAQKKEGRRSWNGIRKILCASKFPKVFFPYIRRAKSEKCPTCKISPSNRVSFPFWPGFALLRPPLPPPEDQKKKKYVCTAGWRLQARANFSRKKGVLIFNSSHAPRFPFLATYAGKENPSLLFSHACAHTRRKKDRLTSKPSLFYPPSSLFPRHNLI